MRNNLGKDLIEFGLERKYLKETGMLKEKKGINCNRLMAIGLPLALFFGSLVGVISGGYDQTKKLSNQGYSRSQIEFMRDSSWVIPGRNLYYWVHDIK